MVYQKIKENTNKINVTIMHFAILQKIHEKTKQLDLSVVNRN